MTRRATLLGAVALLLLAGGAGGAYWRFGGETMEPDRTEDDTDLPLPPVPPRIAEGEEYEACLAMIDTDPSAAIKLAADWSGKGGGEGATHCLALARIATGDPADGAQMLEMLAAGSQSSVVARAIVFGQAGQAWVMAGDAARAYAAASQAVSLSPDDPDLLIDRASLATNLQNYQAAVADLTQALTLDPRRTDALIARSTAWRRAGKLQAAQDDIDRALEADPDDPEALLERGILRQRREDRTGARKDWERAIALAPDTPTADLAEQNLALLDAGPSVR